MGKLAVVSPMLLSFVSLLGCGNGALEVVPASGIVTYKDVPVEGADVTFAKEGASAFSFGRTDSKGEFQLSTFGTGDGAITGVNAVSIAKSPPMESSVSDGGLPKDAESASKYGQSQNFGRFSDKNWLASQKAQQKSAASKPTSIPQKYATPDKSGLKFTVVKGQPNKFKIDLKD